MHKITILLYLILSIIFIDSPAAQTGANTLQTAQNSAKNNRDNIPYSPTGKENNPRHNFAAYAPAPQNYNPGNNHYINSSNFGIFINGGLSFFQSDRVTTSGWAPLHAVNIGASYRPINNLYLKASLFTYGLGTPSITNKPTAVPQLQLTFAVDAITYYTGFEATVGYNILRKPNDGYSRFELKPFVGFNFGGSYHKLTYITTSKPGAAYPKFGASILAGLNFAYRAAPNLWLNLDAAYQFTTAGNNTVLPNSMINATLGIEYRFFIY